jgi:hypothetical protein
MTILFSHSIFAQKITFLKTTGRKKLHYLEFISDKVIVYKMGRYYDNGGSGSAIRLTDTLTFTSQNEYKGNHYSLIYKDNLYTLIFNNGTIKYETEPIEDINKVNSELNNAYCLKCHFDLSYKLNKEFPLYHYTFRNGFSAWAKQPNKTISHKEFIEKKDQEIAIIFDSISRKQIEFAKTTNFIIDKVNQVNYSILKDSISTLPVDFKPKSGYFDKSVYHMTKANAEYFYKLLQDFPKSKKFIYYAVEQDKELVKQLKQIQGYDDLKKEFLKDYNSNKIELYRTIGIYAIITGLLTWLIITQP